MTYEVVRDMETLKTPGCAECENYTLTVEKRSSKLKKLNAVEDLR